MCVSPITLRRERLGIPTLEAVPCGKCPECVKDNQNSYVIRSIEEQRKRGMMWFITLTYAPDNVPVAFDSDGEIVDERLVPVAKNPSKFRHLDDEDDVTMYHFDNSDIEPNYDFDNQKDLDSPDCVFGLDYLLSEQKIRVQSEIAQENALTPDDLVDPETGELPVDVYSLDSQDIIDWKKRCRRRIEYHAGHKVDFGYMICGEYGPRTHRPHYHGLLVGLTVEEMLVFKEDWERNYGYTCFKKISSTDVERTAKYVAKYITKQKCLEDDRVVRGLVQKPRKITSIGYGVPTEERLARLLVDIAGADGASIIQDNPDGISELNPLRVDRVVRKMSKSMRYTTTNIDRNGKESVRKYKLPRYYKVKYLYVKDAVTGRPRPSALLRLVTQAILDNVYEDFIGQCREMAAGYPDPTSYETMLDVSRRISESEKARRLANAETIIETNKSVFRKSRF